MNDSTMIHPADVAKLDSNARQVRAMLMDAIGEINDIKHAVANAQRADTVPNLLAQLEMRLDRAHSRLDEGIKAVAL